MWYSLWSIVKSEWLQKVEFMCQLRQFRGWPTSWYFLFWWPSHENIHSMTTTTSKIKTVLNHPPGTLVCRPSLLNSSKSSISPQTALSCLRWPTTRPDTVVCPTNRFPVGWILPRAMLVTRSQRITSIYGLHGLYILSHLKYMPN